MYFDIKNLVTNILKLFVKLEVIEGCKTASDLLEIELSMEKYLLKVSQIAVGFVTEKSLSDLMKKDLVEVKKVKECVKKCKFLVSMLQKIFERSPLQSAVVRSSHIFDPKVMVSYSASGSEICLNGLLHQLMSFSILQPTFCDKVRESFHNVLTEDLVLHEEKFVSYDRATQRLDDFYFNSTVNVKKYPELSFVLKFVFVLSHGQAVVERGFNLKDQSLKENISAESLNAHRIVIDHMVSCNVKPETIDISDKLLLSAKCSRLKYEEAKRQNREIEESETRNHNLEIINEEIADVKAKAENLSKVNEHLDKEFEGFVYETDKNPERA